MDHPKDWQHRLLNPIGYVLGISYPLLALSTGARGVLMMALSNKFGSLLLTTGNKSEVAVGYCTLYGDMAGGLAVISDVFKTNASTAV